MTQKQAFIEHGKLPPQAVDIEEAVLGAMMLERHSIPLVASMLSEDVFYKDAHQVIYRSIISLYDTNNPVDILTVTNDLKSKGNLELAGGAFYITQLTSRIVSSANIEYQAGILVQKFVQRELIRVSTEIIRDAYEDTTDPFQQLEIADINISKINEFSARGGSMVHISEAVSEAIDEARKRQVNANLGKSVGINTGLLDLNEATGGWRNSDLIILAARPGMGKTAIMLHWAKSAAVSGSAVCVYSLEMGATSLANRMLYSMCDVDIDNYKKGKQNDQDWSEISYAADQLNKLPIYIDPNPMVTMRYIKSNSRIMKKKGKCDIIMIDYLQLVDVNNGDRNSNREQKVAEASRQAKIIAKELDLPVILLCQMSRKVEGRADHEPELSDLRESGAIEQDADMVIFAFRPEYYGKIEDSRGNSLKGVGKLYIRKFRDGPLSDIKFKYNTTMSKITNFLPEFINNSQIKPNQGFDQVELPQNPNF